MAGGTCRVAYSADRTTIANARDPDRPAFGVRPRQSVEMVVGREVLLDVELVLERA